jgi:alanyl-tRNA synthetase
MTEKLYYLDSPLFHFDAVVTDCRPEDEGWVVELDRTAFFPEGGGQSADTGRIGEARISDVHERGGRILHSADRFLEPGTEVLCELDAEQRLRRMQNHSGEHIVSGLICSRFSCSNVGFHLGAESVLIDYDAPVGEEELQQIEDEANRYIWEDHETEILWPDAEELKTLDYRSKKDLEGDVRIVRFPGADCCACCGTHVSSSGGVGLVKFISRQKFHDGVRLELLCGKRALEHLSAHRLQNLGVSRLLSAKWHATAPAVEKALAELESERLRANVNEERYFESFAAAYEGRGDAVVVFDSLSPESTRKLCDSIYRVCGGRAAVFAGGPDSYRYAVMEPDDAGLRETVKRINATLNGRGGGRDGLAQGSVSCAADRIRPLFLDCGWRLE